MAAATGIGSLGVRHPSETIRRAALTKAAGSDLGAIKHVVFLMQENRSFDHYFGAYPGVIGFNDRSPSAVHAFRQPYPGNHLRPPVGLQLPFHLDTRTGRGECIHDLNHDWVPQHASWNHGTMDAFVDTHVSRYVDGPAGLLTMGYYDRVDIPYHYALADAFTICDRYHCSVMGPTHPNRLMAISGTIDPAGTRGGPVISTEGGVRALYSAHWTTVPELLQDKGVSWKTYTARDEGVQLAHPELGFGNTILPYFSQYRNPRSVLYKRAFEPVYPGDFVSDVRRGTLPSVSWITPPNGYDEHPPAPPANGARLMDQILATLVSNKEVWSHTVLFICYDENGGFFDHVAPPVPPLGTPGEYLSVRSLPSATGGIYGPVGLGFRVPMLVVSPFSRGGHVTSDVLDHTSQIKFLEERFGIYASEISLWRRKTVGDLTTTLKMKSPNVSVVRLPNTANYSTTALTVQGCTISDVEETSTQQPMYQLPAVQVMPHQES